MQKGPANSWTSLYGTSSVASKFLIPNNNPLINPIPISIQCKKKGREPPLPQINQNAKKQEVLKHYKDIY